MEIFATLNLFLSEAWSVIARRCREKKKDWKEPLSILRQFESSLEIIWVEDLKDKHAKIVDEIIKNNEELNYNDVVPVEVLKERGMRLLTLDRALERYVKEAARKRL